MRPSPRLIEFLLLILMAGCNKSDPATLEIPPTLETYQDGRASIQQIYASYDRLLEQGWRMDVITVSNPAGTTVGLPIIALKSPRTGPAAWFLTGIHGEEPAGPNAMAASIDALSALGERYPVVILPLCNPHGYARNWRYLNVAVYSEEIDGQSVGDSSHMLLAEAPASGPRASTPSSPEADAITGYILETSSEYPPRYSIDLHEDNLIHEGYVYSQGLNGAEDPLAIEAVEILRANNIGIKMDGQTRFEEDIVDGIIGPVTDSSVDELMSAARIWHNGAESDGPAAHTVLVFETPAAHLSIDQRIQAHAGLLERLTTLIGNQ